MIRVSLDRLGDHTFNRWWQSHNGKFRILAGPRFRIIPAHVGCYHRVVNPRETTMHIIDIDLRVREVYLV